MQIIPVLDLLDGAVVRGVAGKRDEYRPIESCLVSGCEPPGVANAFRERLNLSTLYVADLDAILHDRPNYAAYQQLADAGFSLWTDAGLRELSRAGTILNSGAEAIIVGLETTPGPDHVRNLCQQYSTDRVLFSLDMQAGQPLGELTNWKSQEPEEIAAEAIQMGVRRMIVLDLAQVGTAEGVPTRKLCERLLHRHPQLEIITGGGVRNLDDLIALSRIGVSGVLIASALHNGQIGRSEIEQIHAMV